jgi:hypothetical protein
MWFVNWIQLFLIIYYNKRWYISLRTLPNLPQVELCICPINGTMGNTVGHLIGNEETICDPLSIEVGEALPVENMPAIWSHVPQNEGRPRRNYKKHDRMHYLPFEDEPDVNTGFKIFERAARLYTNDNFLGHREVRFTYVLLFTALQGTCRRNSWKLRLGNLWRSQHAGDQVFEYDIRSKK